MEQKFYICKHCGSIITKIKDSGVDVVCCGEKMSEIIPGTSDGAADKHVPVVQVEGNTVTVKVGSTTHPMAPVHYIEWIAVQTDRGISFKKLNPGEEPAAVFTLADNEKFETAFAYCNLHSLWKA